MHPQPHLHSLILLLPCPIRTHVKGGRQAGYGPTALWRRLICCRLVHTFPEMFGREEEIIFLNEKAQLFNKIEATKVVINECPRRLRFSFSNFLDQLKNKVDDDDFWRDFDVPGWKIKDLDLSFKKEFRVRSPDLLEFNSIAAAYRFMMKSRHNYTEEERQVGKYCRQFKKNQHLQVLDSYHSLEYLPPHSKVSK